MSTKWSMYRFDITNHFSALVKADTICELSLFLLLIHSAMLPIDKKTSMKGSTDSVPSPPPSVASSGSPFVDNETTSVDTSAGHDSSVGSNHDDDMILSIELKSHQFDKFLHHGNRRMTVLDWHFTTGYPRTRWTEAETDALAAFMYNQVRNDEDLFELKVNLSEFQRKYCSYRSVVEIHDRALCIIPLLHYDLIPDIHDILDMPYTSFEYTASERDLAFLSRSFKDRVSKQILEHLQEWNSDTWTEIKEDKSSRREEMMELYSEGLVFHSKVITGKMLEILHAYWHHYDNPKPFASSVADGFDIHYEDIFAITEMDVFSFNAIFETT